MNRIKDNSDDRLRQLVMKELPVRYPEQDDNLNLMVERELSIIATHNLASDFLLHKDLVIWAQNQKIPIDSICRYSPSSLINYILGITSVDPISFGLHFESFWNPLRKKSPTVMIDVGYSWREAVINHLEELYGVDNVAVGTNSKSSSEKGCCNDSLSKLAIRPEVIRTSQLAVVVSMPGTMELRPRYKNAESTHGEVQLTEAQAIDLGASIVIITESEVLARLATIVQRLNDYGMKINLDTIPLVDERTMQLFRECNTEGVLLFEEANLKRLLVEICPNSFEDLMLIYTVCYPGMQAFIPDIALAKKTMIIPTHGCLEFDAILSNSYGQMIYKEQAVQILHDVFGFGFDMSYVISRSLSGRITPNKKKVIEEFKMNAKNKGIDHKVWLGLLNYIEGRTNYTFSKAVMAASVKIAWNSAFLKAHYPEAYSDCNSFT
ncbi:MAG: hypothetical protein JXR78_08600 [Victivallales bacterium]|nr:hypothetical protein [Victivallales bacterium]